MEPSLFHVLLGGRILGPYDRRTIVGMRVRKTLTSEHELIDSAGLPLTVADLIGRPRADASLPSRGSALSIVQASFPASVVALEGRGAMPVFRGEVEVRVQGKIVRIAGCLRQGLGWREDRVKLALGDFVHAGVEGSRAQLGLRGKGRRVQRVTLELFTPQAAMALLGWLPAATPWPGPASPAQALQPARFPVLWIPVLVALGVVCIAVAVLMRRRFY